MTSQPVIVSMYPHYDMNSAYIETQRRFTDSDLRGIRAINGVSRVGVNDFTIDIELGRAFDYNGLVAKSLEEVLRLLGTTVDNADIKLGHTPLNKESDRQRLKDVIRLIKPMPEPLLRNPIAPFAAILDDIKVGAELLKVSYDRFSFTDTFTVTGPLVNDGIGWRIAIKGTGNCPASRYSGEQYLCDMGVLPYNAKSDNWNDTYLTIVNTVENRRALVNWLLERGDSSGLQVVKKIINSYIEDFVSVDVVFKDLVPPFWVTEINVNSIGINH